MLKTILEIEKRVEKETLEKILGLMERKEIIWHLPRNSFVYQARWSCGMHVVKIKMDIHPFQTLEGNKIARFWTSHPNLLGSNFNITGVFFDSSMQLISAIEKQTGKTLE